MLVDNHGRTVNYLRIAVTDRCNLRCLYCMPEDVHYVAREELMDYEEMLRTLQLLVPMGIQKLRITGGEPFVRKDMDYFLRQVHKNHPNLNLHITTNGVLTANYIPMLKEIGIRSVNLSLDTLDQERFFALTRRDCLPQVLDTYRALINADIKTKVNMVVMRQHNTEDIIPMAMLTREDPVEMRYIEEMPFSGHAESNLQPFHYTDILASLQTAFPQMEPQPTAFGDTAKCYTIPGHKGRVGIIAAYSRTFCGTCNRLRLTPLGMIKTCLYDEGVFNIKELMRVGESDNAIRERIVAAIGNRAKDGFEAESSRSSDGIFESMSTIGG